MQVLSEIRFNDNRILLKDHLVRSPILPKVSSELDRDVVVQGDCVIEGAVYARNLEVQQGSLQIKGAVFTQIELHVNADAVGTAVFEKSVASADSVVSLAQGLRPFFLADISAKQVKLCNAYVAANIFADEIVLENCVVIGGVFATRSLELSDCIVGTFNSPVVRAAKSVYLLFPSAFSVEKVSALPGTEFYSLTLADLGALIRGAAGAQNSGKIRMNIEQDEVKTVLSADGVQQMLRTYSVVGKVLATGLVDYDRLQNQFLIACASMGNQLLHSYDLGTDRDGTPVELTPQRIAEFFFGILHGKIAVGLLSGEFDLASIVKGLTPILVEHPSSSAVPDEADPTAPEVDDSAIAQVVEDIDPPSDLPTDAPKEGQEDTEARVATESGFVSPEEEERITPPPESEAPSFDQPTPLRNALDTQQAGEKENVTKSLWKCPHCQADIEGDCVFCDSCGKPIL